MLACLLALISWLIWSRVRTTGFQQRLFWATLTQLDRGWLVASVGCILLTYLGRVIRWEVMLRPLNPHASRRNLLSATIIGFTAIVLFGRAGELVRPYLIAAKERVPFPSQVAAWAVERIYDLLMVLVLFGYALWEADRSQVHFGPRVGAFLEWGGGSVAVLAFACLLALFSAPKLVVWTERNLLHYLRFLPEPVTVRLERAIASFAAGLAIAGQRRTALALTLYTALEWLLILACYYCLFRSFPDTADFQLVDITLFLGFVSFGSIVQIPGVGGGMQIAAVVVLTELFELSLESATGMALLLWVVTFVVIVPVGVIFALQEGLSWRKFREIERAASQ